LYLRLWHEFRRERAVLELVDVEGGEEGMVQNLDRRPFLHAEAPAGEKVRRSGACTLRGGGTAQRGTYSEGSALRSWLMMERTSGSRVLLSRRDDRCKPLLVTIAMLVKSSVTLSAFLGAKGVDAMTIS